MIIFYNLLIGVAILIGMPFLTVLLTHKKRRTTFVHRLGFTTRRQLGLTCPMLLKKRVKPIWVHALSLGEVLSSEPIINQMRFALPHIPIVFSSSTMTGYSVARNKFSEKVASVIYFPYDLPFSVINALRLINPRIMVMVETDIWPNFLYVLKKKTIPMLLVNTRLSDRSFRNYRKAGGLTRWIFSMIDRFGVQSSQDASRFQNLGIPAERITLTGNAKFDQCDTSEDLESAKRIRQDLGLSDNALVIIAGSTHSGEEGMLCDAFLKIRNSYPQLKMILAPRDPNRASAVAAQCTEKGLDWSFLNNLDPSSADTTSPIRIVNTIGQLRRLYAAADIAFIGGSLIPFGGHNPLEPAVFSKPILFGPFMHDFRAIAELLVQGNGAVQLEQITDLTSTLLKLLKNDGRRAELGINAHTVLMANQGATDRTMAMIMSFLK